MRLWIRVLANRAGPRTRRSTICHCLDVYGVRFVVGLSFFLLVLGEFFFEPGFVTEGGVGDAARVDHDLLGTRLESGPAEIGGGSLQGIEEEGSGLVVDLVGEEETQALHERDLNRVGVFEDGHVEGVARAAGAVGVELDSSLLPALVEVA